MVGGEARWGRGNVESLGNIVNRGLHPVQIAVGVTVEATDEAGMPLRDGEGKPVLKAKYTGLMPCGTSMRPGLINRKADSGLELPPKVVQARLGHATIQMTMDVYGHIVPRGDDSAELAEAEHRLLG